jgi:hypothetical protein
MRSQARLCVGFLSAALSTAAFAAKTCYSVDEAAAHVNKDVCIAAHVYDVVEVADGTRFLDVCRPGAADMSCHFTILSPRLDRKDVGDLQQYRDADVRVRGIVRPAGARTEIIVSHARQFHGGAEKFRPNPALMKGFSAGDAKPPVADPAFRGSSKSGARTGNY